MKEIPILFNGPMVVALLNGTKTQTRRPIKPQPKITHTGKGYDRKMSVDLRLIEDGPCPYGQRGDRLWVRETFTIETNFNLDPCDPPFKDGRPVQWHQDEGWGNWWEQPHYRATDPSPDLFHEDDCRQCEDNGYCNKWKPSMHMPRWCARIFLEVAAVRTERLQDITEDDAKAEGVARGAYHRMGFKHLWNSVYENWDANPWVWVIDFKRIEAAKETGVTNAKEKEDDEDETVSRR